MRTGEHANQSCQARRKGGMGGAHFGQASLRMNESWVVIALTAKGVSAAFHATVGTDRRSAVTALRNGSLAAGHPNVVISEFNLAVHGFQSLLEQ